MARKKAAELAIEDRLALVEHRYTELAQENVALWNRLRAVDDRLEELGFVATHHSADIKHVLDERQEVLALLFACQADGCIESRAPGSDWCEAHGTAQDDSSDCEHFDVMTIDGVRRCVRCGQPMPATEPVPRADG
jgi:hypothetical protein